MAITTANDLKTHLELNKKCSEKNFVCPECPPECPKFYDSHIKVIRHRVVHRNDPKFNCDKCQKAFKSKRILVTHLSKGNFFQKVLLNVFFNQTDEPNPCPELLNPINCTDEILIVFDL